ncbi:HAMP domain-containing protein [Streptomyces odontomachi]|uniref:HAMP domain-containing protein n=1 Tax=Streptomyces odontomachi TaxID=2944940 RepID=UPI00210BCDC8|nr:HAMP domain-containing protein [Streptomyces sp. ODS25]
MQDQDTQSVRTADLRPLLGALQSLCDGDFSVRVAEDGDGVLGQMAGSINRVAARNAHLASEMRRVRDTVNRTGSLDERITASPGQGAWAETVKEANELAEALALPMTNATRVLEAVAEGDLSQHMELRVGTRQLHGDLRSLALALNGVVNRLSSFTGEVMRVAHEVGTEGRLGGRASVQGLSGSWRGVTEAVNTMAFRLTQQVRDIAAVTTAVASGDLTRKVTVETAGELLELKLTVNTMVDQLSAFADEVTRVAREVGTEGILGGQAQVRDVSGVWKDLTNNVNFMASNLTTQVRNIAQVTTAVGRGDFSQKVTVEAKGEIRQLMSTVNTMVDQLSAFADEVTRVAREVGTDGILGGQAQVRDVSGVWKDLTDNVNFMASNLTSQVRNIAQVATAVANGDLSKKIDVDARGEILELKTTLNTMVDQLSAFADEVTRVAREVGTDGNLGGQAQVRDVSGVWKDLTDNVNFMASNLTSQVRNIAQVTTAVANGDLSKKIDVDARGEILELKTTVNSMVQQLRDFADEVTRVAREVGTEGILGGRAQVHGVYGVWKDLTDNVNFMASNLTSQVRNIAQVTTAVANGDLSKRIDVDARGEILELKTTVNSMVQQLRDFADEVTRVAREVGSEGILGGQARVEGVSGNWKRLTTGVNELALNLTTQVRAIGEVASAVAKGDMSRSITVEAQGEVADLKDNVNRMVSNLRETTRTKDWLESNLTRIAGLMQGHRDLVEVADLILRELAPLVNAHSEVFFLVDYTAEPGEGLELLADYGIGGRGREDLQSESPLRGLIAQAVRQKERILIEDAPPDYVTVESGLGSSPASSILILPILFEDRLLGVIELASFRKFNEIQLTFVDQFAHTIGVSFNTILANARTEALLSESQRLTSELRKRSDELQRSNAELEEKAALLATSSQYKSEFLANMSHELRTPLNSLLILARLLADNPDGRLSDQEVDFASTIYSSGSDLLQLINDILDLSKVEAGRMDVHPTKVPLTKLLDYVHATFRPLTIDRGLGFDIAVGENVPRELYSDEQRIQQVLRNLLSNAVKFTNTGGVELRVERVPAEAQEDFEEMTLREADTVVAFAVKDTGIGIPAEKLSVVFEAFQQSEGTTNRKYGGTGLGLSISREIAGLLGGRIDAESEVGTGSRFTLYVPAQLPSVALAAASGSATPQLSDVDIDRLVEQGAGARTDGNRAVAGAPSSHREPEAAPRDGAPDDHVLASAGTPPVLPEGGTRADRAAADTEPESAEATPPESAAPETSGTPGTPATPEATAPAPGKVEPRPRPDTAAGPPATAAAGPEAPATRPEPAEWPMPQLHGDRDREDIWPETTRLKQWLSGPAGRVLTGRHILIVDDDIRTVFALTHMLGRVGISVKYAENGREGFQVLDRSPEISLVLMDIMMPEVDGYEAIRTIRGTPRLAGLPIIALTAKAMPGDREKAIEAGANGYVPKPVNVDELLAAIYDELEARDDGQIAAAGQQTPDVEPATTEPASAGQQPSGRSSPGEDSPGWQTTRPREEALTREQLREATRREQEQQHPPPDDGGPAPRGRSA